MIRRFALSVLIAAATAGGLQAQENPDEAKARLGEVKKAISETEAEKKAREEERQKAEAEARQLSRDMVAAAADIRQAEANVERIEQRIDDLNAAAEAKKQELEVHRHELLGLLAALERLSKRPVAFTFLQPQEALKTARSASLMSTLVPRINDRADKLKSELVALATIQANLAAERQSLQINLAQLTDRQDKLASLLKRREAEAREARAASDKASQNLAKFAREARSLEELIDKLERQAAKERELAAMAARLPKPKPTIPTTPAPGGKPIGNAKGNLPFPVTGSVATAFGAKDGMGVTRGIRIKARAGAQVVAPYDGQIVFAGPFLGYGRMLIISHGDGYHSLLAGLDEMYGVVGQWVLTGEPVGTMAAKDGATELYMELRHKGSAIDPAPWLNRKTAAVQ
ncbi:MAG: hypothetical protein EP335_16975 [Alphaproteobacteria bacterium]|nr:MAG: hypothetical protein EP335_16975 [Alphaproteobacteria bacterium]